jgi:hypothetical protein
MAGSGTVLRQAALSGRSAIGYDLDPLAVCIARAETMRIDGARVEAAAAQAVREAERLQLSETALPWIDQDEETVHFIGYWFARKQRTALRKLARVLWSGQWDAADRNILFVALSRLIVTKERGASLARDVSHSRPHRVAATNDFDVLDEFRRAARRVGEYVSANPKGNHISIGLGDARRLAVRSASVDGVITSPPYLNAIDYLRGHRLSLVWMGYSLKDLRRIRGDSIGAERSAQEWSDKGVDCIVKAIADSRALSSRHHGLLRRYAGDIRLVMSEAARVIKPNGRVVIVIGNSCLEGTFFHNSAGVTVAARMAGLELESESERDLPLASRYLPVPADRTCALSKRIRTENVLTFSRN